MTNRFKIGEIVFIEGIGKSSKEGVKGLAIIEYKEYEYNEYFVTILSEDRQDWFQEKDIHPIWKKNAKKSQKYKVVLVLEKRGLEIIQHQIENISNQKNNVLKKADWYNEYKIGEKIYVILIWTSTYWCQSNFSVQCIQNNLKFLRKNNIGYQQIIIPEEKTTRIEINQFIENDANVDIFQIEPRIKIKKMGGILI